jgi:hypothetical protein
MRCSRGAISAMAIEVAAAEFTRKSLPIVGIAR